MRKKIAPVDIKHYDLIRQNVEKFITYCASKYDRIDAIILEIAPQVHQDAGHYFKKSQISTLDIDPSSSPTFVADLCEDNSSIIASNTFDYVVCTEVIEHTLNPFLAVQEIYRIMKKGGKAFISVPFNFRIHGPLPDCWRISEHGLNSLFNPKVGFKVLSLNALETEKRFLMPIHYTLIVEKI
jgi:SAM-dependent methyltransferase